jgi:hypothetical protein
LSEKQGIIYFMMFLLGVAVGGVIAYFTHDKITALIIKMRGK